MFAVCIALLVVLTTFVGLPAAASPVPTAAADTRVDERYGNGYYGHGYWHCRSGGDWYWYEGNDKCYKRDQWWYCHEPKGHGREHDHGGGY